MKVPPFFIIGAQRSGTTLLRLMLNSHSQVAIPEEGTFWMPMLRRHKSNVGRTLRASEIEKYLEYIRKNSQFKLWGIDATSLFDDMQNNGNCTLRELMDRLYRFYAGSANKATWGDKTPSFFRMIPVLAELFPEARFIHIVRDGRDLYLSWKKMDASKKNISVAAFEWQYKVDTARIALEGLGPFRYLEIRYEDLVSAPANAMDKVCNFLGLEYEERVLDYWQTSSKFIGSHHSELIFQPPSTSSIGKWRKMLGRSDVRIFESTAGPCLKRYGYQLSDESTPRLVERLYVITKLACGLPLRMAQVAWKALILDLSSRFGWATHAAGRGATPNGRQRQGGKRQARSKGY